MIKVTADIIDSRCVWDGPRNEYRYTLHRVWDPSKPRIVFIGLNPSVADEHQDDNTVRKCINIARRDGYGSMTMLNAYAYRSTDPKALTTHPDVIGTHNDRYIAEACSEADKIVVAWGNHVTDDRHNTLLRVLDGHKLYCFAKNRNGKPKHPLYVSLKAPLFPYRK
ncbi:MAG: DUF1643 domain-containing protein [Methanocella sp.]|jgi:hypothetical protein